MSLKHLSRQDIDIYVYGNQDDQWMDMARLHLKTCDQCRKKVTEHKSILSELDHMEDFEINSDFSQRIVKKLPDTYPQRDKPVLEIFSICAALLIIIGSFNLFVDKPVSIYVSLAKTASILAQTFIDIVKQIQISQKAEIFLLFIINAAIFKTLDISFSRFRKKRLSATDK